MFEEIHRLPDSEIDEMFNFYVVSNMEKSVKIKMIIIYLEIIHGILD